MCRQILRYKKSPGEGKEGKLVIISGDAVTYVDKYLVLSLST